LTIEKIIQRIDGLLKKANYETLALGNFAINKIKFCFDLLVKKEDLVFSVKIFPNIDNLNESVIHDIKSLSLILKSKPLLIGIRNRYQKLEDNTIYVRDGLPMRPSEKIAEQISEILENNDLFKKINLFEWTIKDDLDEKGVSEEKELSKFESHVQNIIMDIGLSSYWYKKGSIPFKLSLYSHSPKISKDSFYPLFSGISEEQGKINEMNFQCLKLFTDLFHKNSLFIIDNNIKIPEQLKNTNIPIVKIKNLEEVDDEEEFIELVQES